MKICDPKPPGTLWSTPSLYGTALPINIYIYIYIYIQGNLGGKVSSLESESISGCEKKSSYNMCLIPNGYPDGAV